MSLTAITTSYSAFTETAVLVQSQLRRVGVVMDLQVLDQALVRSRLATGDFDALFNFIGTGAKARRYFGRDSPVGYRKAGSVVNYGYTLGYKGTTTMTFASVAEVRNHLSKYLARVRRRNEAIVVTHHGKPCALIQPFSEHDLEALNWERLVTDRLRAAWEGEEDALYDYL